ncbi:aldose 1-epimerase [Aaosphaeria arxii CBS 175.79]|uniref:Aldose 1-epimerase n=1 Tax=Aaosphaeria arxii CBS 175.79 TaxID=1450172 RepID=A0A6A5XTG2_9PLEO|nr:aldose 1-epimerase [Aaosphaeria arxii CBS 175.79]KAF2016196.1 aldose 1-epimerase [Aaosphaeria arxii CBS 175.79]
MRYSSCLFAASAAVSAVYAAPEPDADGRYTIEAEGIRAQFIPYAATLTNLYVKDKNGVERDIVLGYDNTSFYPVDPGHPVYNAIPGRYANRIGNGTFTIDNTTYHTVKNDGPNTLHSGPNNWSFNFWKVGKVTKKSITFTYHDPANRTVGMPGAIDASVTYSVSKNKWNIEIDAASLDVKTPIQVTQHTYFQLDAFSNPNGNRTIWNHTLHMPYAKRVMVADANALPTGEIAKVPENAIDDFWSKPHQLGFASGNSNFENHCGGGCHGYNGNWAHDDDRPRDAVVATLASAWSGIKADLRTNQDGIVIYTCNWNDGKSEFKDTQGTGKANQTDKFIPRDGCIAIESQDYVDGINHPEWGRLKKQIFGPGDKYHWQSSWTFGTL